MARQDSHTEYIIRKAAYQLALASLPATGTTDQVAKSAPVMAFEYRQKVKENMNAGKWAMWGVALESFDFEWRNGAWQPPANLVVQAD